MFSRLAKMCDMVSALLINVLSSARLREPRERRGDPGFFFVILSLFSLFYDLQEKYIYKCQNLDRFTSFAKTYAIVSALFINVLPLAPLREPRERRGDPAFFFVLFVYFAVSYRPSSICPLLTTHH